MLWLEVSVGQIIEFRLPAVDNSYNIPRIVDAFSKTQSYVPLFPGKYYKLSSTIMAEYTAALDFDRRNIATGGVDLSIFPWEMFADTNERTLRTYTLSQVIQDLLYQLQQPKSVLICGPDMSNTRVIQCCEDANVDVTLLNTVFLDYFEQCVKTINPRFASVNYDVLTMQDLESGNSKKFDLIELWHNQVDTTFTNIQHYTSLLNDKGMLLINGSSDWAFLYENETDAHPMFDLHDELKSDESLYVYHIPLHYGYTVAVKK